MPGLRSPGPAIWALFVPGVGRARPGPRGEADHQAAAPSAPPAFGPQDPPQVAGGDATPGAGRSVLCARRVLGHLGAGERGPAVLDKRRPDEAAAGRTFDRRLDARASAEAAWVLIRGRGRDQVCRAGEDERQGQREEKRHRGGAHGPRRFARCMPRPFSSVIPRLWDPSGGQPRWRLCQGERPPEVAGAGGVRWGDPSRAGEVVGAAGLEPATSSV